MNVLWFSAGVSSAVCLSFCRNELDKAIYQHIDDQHPDTLRFLRDVETALLFPIDIRQSPYRSVSAVLRQFRSVNSPKGAKCTGILKLRERQIWEDDNPGRHTYFWGMDIDERDRAEGILKRMPQHNHRFPLIERELTKQDAHGIMCNLGIKRPLMYDMGYANNNCIGCVKGGMGYWNKIRVDFPDVFADRAKMEREIGHTCINGVFLDELDPAAGRNDPPISQECGIFCFMNTK